MWDSENKSLTLCHTDRIVTVKDAGDKNQAGHVAADIMMSGIYGEHEIQERHQKFDEKAEKAMDKPKWDEKLAHYQSEEGKQERIAEIQEAKKLSDARKEQIIEKIAAEETNLEPVDYTNLCTAWHAKRKSVQFNHICKACKLLLPPPQKSNRGREYFFNLKLDKNCYDIVPN